jgi:predicted Zn finger-like uncharacterized protein
MIITCTSCLTKFNLDDSRIRTTGVKVRCSRCKHVFAFVPPPETKEEINKDLETFAKYHEGLMEAEEEETPPVLQAEKKGIAPEEQKLLKTEEAPLFPEEVTLPGGEAEQTFPDEKEREKKAPFEAVRTVRRERKGSFLFFMVVIVILLLIVGVFYLWTELRSGGRLAPYVESPVRQITKLWGQLWGTEKEGLTVKDLNGYEEKTTGADFFVIEGRVHNQSRFPKKFVKVRVVIFDQNRSKIIEKEVICGRVLGRGELKRLPRDLLEAAILKPPPEGEMALPSGKTTPFMVIFRDLPSQAKEFEVEIVAAPNA